MIRDSIKQILTYGTGSIAQSALNFILLPLYLRFFEPSEYGVISLLLVSISLLTLFANVGIVSGLFMLYYEAKPGEKRKLIGTTWFWHLFGAVVGGAILVSNASGISTLLFDSADYSYAIRLVGGYFFFSLLLDIPLAAFRLEKKAVHFVAFSLFRFVADFGLKLLFIAFLSRGINGYFESGVIVNAAVLISMIPFTLKYISFSLNKSYLKQLLRLGSPFIFSTIAVWTLSMADRLILNHFNGTAEVGIYSLAYSLANIFTIILVTPFGLFWAPFFLSFASENPIKDTKLLLEKATRYTFILGSTTFLAISLGAYDILIIFTDLFGTKEGYLEAIVLVPVLTSGLFFHFLHGRFGSPLSVIKRPIYFAIAGSIAAVINLGLNFLLIPRFGAMGAAITTTVAYAVFMAATYLLTQRLFPMSYKWFSMAKSLVFLVISFILGWLLVIDSPWISLFVKEILGVGTFIVLSWFFGGILSKDERRWLLTHVMSTVRRFNYRR